MKGQFWNRLSLSVVLSIICLLFQSINITAVQAHQLPVNFSTNNSVQNPGNLVLSEVASGIAAPVFITNANDGSGRLFILEKVGFIRILKKGVMLSMPFLDVHTIVNSEGERGILALAFHPNYPSNGRFYIAYNDQSGSLILASYLRSSIDPDQADPSSAVILLTIPKNFSNHNGGTLVFGQDGYLYWSTGDGGGGGDPDNNSQNLNSLLGKILRLDIDSGSPYGIPATNPFYNDPNPSIREEIWAYGLRNPWRISFDRLTHDLYIGDVGQGAREEINFQPAGSVGGENYGWRVMEGSLCYNPFSGCNQSGKVLPVAEYDHSLGCSVTGGNVYRGALYTQLQGLYFYADYCSGRIFSLYKDVTNTWISTQIADTPYLISTFGEAENGELYLADYSGGKIYQLTFPTVLVNSVLPTSRTVPIGTTATVFHTVINAGENTAYGITLSMTVTPPVLPVGTFNYQQTNCATNTIIGAPNPTLDLAPGGILCYVLSFTPIAPFAATNPHIYAIAGNAPSTTLYPGINTWLLRATVSVGPDIIALTTTADLYQTACSGAIAFAVATANVGAAASGDITVTANTGTVSLPISVSIQETNPGTGAIIGDHILKNLGAGENRTVAVFVTFNGCITFDPALNRIFIEFRDTNNNVVGSTSTAVSTNR
ncbi:MAG: PQQ-dependent sugar dehydrogenase [Anaerolineales bacterium]|nr:PQQ-dependent sugar dehydrogenase [Anaerolineales bacterium]